MKNENMNKKDRTDCEVRRNFSIPEGDVGMGVWTPNRDALPEKIKKKLKGSALRAIETEGKTTTLHHANMPGRGEGAGSSTPRSLPWSPDGL